MYKILTKHFMRWKFPVYLWGCFILAVTSYPKIEIPDIGFDAVDKLAHFVVYFIFGYLLIRSFTEGEGLKLSTGIKKTSLIGIGFAMFDEFHQLFIPGRAAEFLDLLADILGIILAQLAFYFVIQLRIKLKKSYSYNTLYGQYYEKK
ncbi:VanZ family protein [candidate division KSB1 bacterium]|nr:VanZ family protein [candidate division KSB1 bacterium]